MRLYIPKEASLVPKDAEKVFSGVFFDTYQWEQKLFDGSTKTFEMVKRADTVQIIAINDGKIILNKEKQPHLLEEYIAIPAGMHDDESENEFQAAKRELREETGYTFKSWKLIEARQSGSGKMEHIVYTFLATDLDQIGEQELDSGEKIEVLEMSFEDFKNAEQMEGMRFYPASIMHGVNSLEELLALPSLFDYEN